MSNRTVSGVWLVLAAATLWGTTGTAQAFAPDGATPLAVGAVRMMVGGVALMLLALAKGGWQRGKPWPLLPTLVAAVSIAAYQLLFFAGVARTGVAVGTIVGIGSSPILAGLLTWLAWRQRPAGRWWLATGLAVAGCSLLALSGGQVVQIDGWGMVLAMGAGLAYAVFTMASKVLLAERPSHEVIGLVFGLGALLLLSLAWSLAWDMRWVTEPRGLMVAVHLGLVTMAIAYWLFTTGLQQVSAATAVSLTLAEPLTAGLLGVFVIGERLGGLAWSGIGLLLAGLFILTRRER
jgi:drug/metabolite transporter, DME family